MDRFSISLLAVMAAVLVAGLGVIFFSKHHQIVEVPEPPAAALKTDPTAAKPHARPLFGDSDVPVAATLPMAANQPMATPAPLLVTAAASVAMPTPMPWSPPNHGKVVTVGYPGFTVVYSVTLGNPLAVQYAMVGGAKPKRYPPPISVPTPKSQLIEAAGYQRGEMALEESIGLYFGKVSSRNTSLMTNTCAFNPACLIGPWDQFAAMEKKYAGDFGWIEVVAGPIFSATPTRAANGLVVPDAFYRVYRRSYGDTMAFIVPQTATSTTLASYLTSIASVEAATGVAIFANTVAPEDRGQTAKEVW
jgi:DNA/RNA endonuclease G (NUC1)